MRPLPSVALVVALLAVNASGAAAPSEPSRADPSLAAHLAPTGERSEAVVQFRAPAVGPAVRAVIGSVGLRIVDELASVPAARVVGDRDAILALARDPRVAYVEPVLPLSFDLFTATHATRARGVWDAVVAATLGVEPLVDDAGRVIDGSGVGVAVVDTGINALHPDLPWKVKVADNFLAVPDQPSSPDDPDAAAPLVFLDVPDSTPLPGVTHGHHVSGILGGLGTAFLERYKGAAPGVAITSFSAVNADTWFAAKAWDWVFVNGASHAPPIRVVTNSWGFALGEPCNPEHTLSKVQRRLVLERNVTMVFSAGNAGGDGSRDETRTQFKCGYGGLIGVASYDDLNAGVRDGPLAPSSSRGARADPSSWPDVAAPGVNIYAPAALNREPPTTTYTAMSGTSMAAPHVAGVAALLLQAHPALSPAEVECLIEETAHRFEDAGPFASGFGDRRHDGSHFAKGHGLVDAHAAVRAALDLRHGVGGGAAATCAGVDPVTEN